MYYLSHSSYGGGTNNVYTAINENGMFAVSMISHAQAIKNLKRRERKI